MIEDKDTAIDNINFNKTFRCNIISCKNQTPHTHRFGIEPCVQSTSEELRKRNEIQTDEDFVFSILISPINGLLIISNGFIQLLDFGRSNPSIGFGVSNTSGSLRTRNL